MRNEHHKLLLEVLPLHDSQIEQKLIKAAPDLDAFLAFSQTVLNNERYHAANTASIMHDMYKPVAEVNIAQIHTVQAVVVRLLTKRTQSTPASEKRTGKYHYSEFATALKRSGIVIDTKGREVVQTDTIARDFVEIFQLRELYPQSKDPGYQLYQEFNAIDPKKGEESAKTRHAERIFSNATEIIKQYKLKKY